MKSKKTGFPNQENLNLLCEKNMQFSLHNKKVLKNIILFIGLILVISGKVFMQELSNLDEMWIYNFARCIANGLLPYKDFNIIITPLFPMISAIFLKIFGDEMIVLRCLGVIEIATILFMTFKILRRLNINQGLSLLLVLWIYQMYSSIFCFDYNWSVLLITLIILYIELKDYKRVLELNFKTDILIGILARNSNTFKANDRNNFIYYSYRI